VPTTQERFESFKARQRFETFKSGEVVPSPPPVTQPTIAPEEEALFDPFGGTAIPDTPFTGGELVPELAAGTAGGIISKGLPAAKRIPIIGLSFAGGEAIKQIGQQLEKEFGVDIPLVSGEKAPKSSEEAAKKIGMAFLIGGGFEIGSIGAGALTKWLAKKVSPVLRPGIEKTFNAIEDFFPENDTAIGSLVRRLGGRPPKVSPLLPAQITESPAIDTLQSIAKRSYLGGGKIIKAEQLTDDILSAALNKEVQSKIGSTGRLQFGEMGMDALQGGVDAFNATAKGMYSSLDDIVRAQFKTDIITGKKTIINGVNVSNLKRNAQNMLAPARAGIRTKEQTAILTEIVNKPDIMSFSNAQTLRSDLLSVSRTGGEVIKGKAQGIARTFSGQIDKAMQAAGKNLPDDALPLFRKASEFYKSGKNTFNSKFVRKLVGSEPDVFLSNALSGDKGTIVSNIRKMRSVIFAKDAQGKLVNKGADETWKKFQGFFAEKMLTNSVSDEISMTIRGASLLREMRKFGDETLEVLAPKGELNQFKEFIRALAINQAKQPGGQGATIFIAMAQAGAVGKIVYTGDVDAASLAILAGPAAIAKIMTNPNTSRLLINGMRPGVKWTVKESAKMAARLGVLFAKEGIDARIVRGTEDQQTQLPRITR
jgi:hypothetical protein